MTEADVAEGLSTRPLHRCTVGADTPVAKRFLDEQVNIVGVRVVIMRLGGVGVRAHQFLTMKATGALRALNNSHQMLCSIGEGIEHRRPQLRQDLARAQ